VGEDALATRPVGADGAGFGTADVHPICATVKGHSVSSLSRIMQSVEVRVHDMS
jgi:hypothetical protein